MSTSADHYWLPKQTNKKAIGCPSKSATASYFVGKQPQNKRERKEKKNTSVFIYFQKTNNKIDPTTNT